MALRAATMGSTSPAFVPRSEHLPCFHPQVQGCPIACSPPLSDCLGSITGRTAAVVACTRALSSCTEHPELSAHRLGSLPVPSQQILLLAQLGLAKAFTPTPAPPAHSSPARAKINTTIPVVCRANIPAEVFPVLPDLGRAELQACRAAAGERQDGAAGWSWEQLWEAGAQSWGAPAARGGGDAAR